MYTQQLVICVFRYLRRLDLGWSTVSLQSDLQIGLPFDITRNSKKFAASRRPETIRFPNNQTAWRKNPRENGSFASYTAQALIHWSSRSGFSLVLCLLWGFYFFFFLFFSLTTRNQEKRRRGRNSSDTAAESPLAANQKPTRLSTIQFLRRLIRCHRFYWKIIPVERRVLWKNVYAEAIRRHFLGRNDPRPAWSYTHIFFKNSIYPHRTVLFQAPFPSLLPSSSSYSYSSSSSSSSHYFFEFNPREKDIKSDKRRLAGKWKVDESKSGRWRRESETRIRMHRGQKWGKAWGARIRSFTEQAYVYT